MLVALALASLVPLGGMAYRLWGMRHEWVFRRAGQGSPNGPGFRWFRVMFPNWFVDVGVPAPMTPETGPLMVWQTPSPVSPPSE